MTTLDYTLHLQRVLVSQLYQTRIRGLRIYNTPLNEEFEHVCCTSQCVISNTLMYLCLENIELTNNKLAALTDALNVNTSLETLDL